MIGARERWTVDDLDEVDRDLLRLLDELDPESDVGFLKDLLEEGVEFGKKKLKEALSDDDDEKRKRQRQREQESQRRELEAARQDKAARDAKDEAERKAELEQRPLKARNRLLEDALRDRIHQVAQLVKERETIRARLRELEAQAAEAGEGWSTEAKIAGGVATAGILLAVLKKLADRSQG